MDKAEALGLYQKLYLVRRCEEKIREEYFKDEMKTPVHLGIGGEAISVGVVQALPPAALTFGTYRNHALYLAKTDDVEGFFGELYGRASGRCKGKAGSMHLCYPERGLVATSAVVGTTIPVALGAAMASRYRGRNEVVAAFFGDGATEEGTFWESLNYASLRGLRLLLICEDNELAIHTHVNDRQGHEGLLSAVSGFRCHAERADGSDLPAVLEAARGILRKMEKDPRPGFLHLSYYRFLEHVGPLEDFKFAYRKKPEEKELQRRDPVHRFEQTLAALGARAEEIANVRSKVDERVLKEVAAAQKAPFPEPSELMTDVFV